MNSPCAPYRESSSGLFTLYVLLMMAARTLLRRIDVVAITVDAMHDCIYDGLDHQHVLLAVLLATHIEYVFELLHQILSKQNEGNENI